MTEEFEWVAVLENQRLTLYLDIFATNEPATGARVEVEGESVKVVATQVSPGVYALPAAAWARPGKHALTVSVQSGDAADLLPMTLEVAGGTVVVAPVAARWTYGVFR